MYDILARILSPFLSKPLLSATIRGILVMTIVMTVAMIGHKLLVEHRERHSRRLWNRYLAFFLSHGVNPPCDQVEPTDRISYIACADVAIYLCSNVRRNERDRYRKMLQELGVLELIRRDAVARSWTKRYKSVEKLGFLLFPELAPFFRGRLTEERDGKHGQTQCGGGARHPGGDRPEHQPVSLGLPAGEQRRQPDNGRSTGRLRGRTPKGEDLYPLLPGKTPGGFVRDTLIRRGLAAPGPG